MGQHEDLYVKYSAADQGSRPMGDARD